MLYPETYWCPKRNTPFGDYGRHERENDSISVDPGMNLCREKASGDNS